MSIKVSSPILMLQYVLLRLLLAVDLSRGCLEVVNGASIYEVFGLNLSLLVSDPDAVHYRVLDVLIKLIGGIYVVAAAKSDVWHVDKHAN